MATTYRRPYLLGPGYDPSELDKGLHLPDMHWVLGAAALLEEVKASTAAAAAKEAQDAQDNLSRQEKETRPDNPTLRTRIVKRRPTP